MIWLRLDALLIAHGLQIEDHGGRPGIRSLALIESALARPRNKQAYAKASVFACAAAYGYGIAKDHPFVDGNKRMALLAMFMFLHRNGRRLAAPETEAYRMVHGLAAGEITEAALAAWLKEWSRRSETDGARKNSRKE